MTAAAAHRASRRGSGWCRWLGAWLVLLAFAVPGQAHISSTGLATLDAQGDTLAYRLTLAVPELGEPGAELVRAAAGDAAAAQRWGQALQQQLGAAVDGQACRIKRLRLQGSQAGGDRVQVAIDWACGRAPGRLQLDDRLTTSFGEHYRSIVSVTLPGGARHEEVLDQAHPQVNLGATGAAGASAAPQGVIGFVRLGAEHILSGADHLLFLAALLMGTRGLRTLLVTATAFTLAHSLSLALAALGLVHAPAAWVEPLIAASIVWVALDNLRSQARMAVPWRRHALAFGFGLVHGLAFAEALVELQLQGAALVRALLAFNVGVELAQAAVIIALAPLLAWVARHPRLRRAERVASLAIAALGGVWLVQRLL